MFKMLRCFTKCLPKVLFVLIVAIAICSAKTTAAHNELNLSLSCGDSKIYFCTITNLTNTFLKPLVIVNVSVPELNELVLRDSVIGSVPNKIFELANHLSSFIMHNCGLNRINPYDFSHAPFLRTLVLQQNRLSAIPEKAFSIAFSLQQLQLGRNTIHMLHHNSFNGLSQLQYLDLQQNAIKELPQKVFADLSNVLHIDLSGNEIEIIDEYTFAQNTKLLSLRLNNNKFNVFAPDSLKNLRNLRLLDVSNSPIEELQLQSVDTLLAQNTELSSVVIEGGIVKLHAGNSQLTNISIGDKLVVREMELRGNKLESLDNFIGMLNLQRLDLSKNQVKTLSTSASPIHLPLPSLTSLNLASNQLHKLTADNFLMLQKLTCLDLAFNHLLRLDQTIFQPLFNLEKFYIEGNRLHAFNYDHFLRNHIYLKEMGFFDNEWDYRYMRKMVAYLKDKGISMPIRFSVNGASMPFDTLAGNHHHYPVTDMDQLFLQTSDTKTKESDCGVGSIHPYWTLHDIFAMITLLTVLCILFMQLFRILKEEGYLVGLCRRRVINENPTNPNRLIEEEDEL